MLVQAQAQGAEALELRVDDATSLSGLDSLDCCDFPLILACRTIVEGGRMSGTAIDAAQRVLDLAAGTPAGVDVAWDAWRESAEIRAAVLKRLDHQPSAIVILSAHFPDSLPQLEPLVRQMLDANPRFIAKVAYSAAGPTDVFPALDLMHRFGPRVIAIAMGESSSWGRVLARKLKVFGTYASLDQGAATAPGQWSVTQLLGQFGWSRIGEQTRLFGVVGDPVGHSLSPTLFNRWFALQQRDAVYLPMRVSGAIEVFLDEIRRRPWLDMDGLSVTIPHKTGALRWAAHGADPMSREIGAANTLVFKASGCSAYNSDSYAAVDALAAALGCLRSDLAGLCVDILGAGGSARAVCHGLAEMGCRLTVYARTIPTGDCLFKWGVTLRRWEDRVESNAPVLINTTPVGMWPKTNDSPMPAESLKSRRLVFDLIYRPLKTGLLRDAEAAGSRTLGGLAMFVRQAATQCSLWTGAVAAPQTIEQSVAMLETILGGDASTNRERPIVLIGARGAGKTTVGALLAGRLGLPHIDTDAFVESAAGQTIAELFQREGESGFRIREAVAVRIALERGAAVVSLGGGALLTPDVAQAVCARGRVVWLTATPNELLRRVSADPASANARPPLTQLSAEVEMTETLRVRHPIYCAAAELTLATDGLKPDAVAIRIADWLQHN